MRLHLLAQASELIEGSKSVLDTHGFPTWVAVSLLVFVCLCSVVLGRWFLDVQRHEITDLTASLEKQTRSLHLLTISILNLQEQLLTHDLTSRGLHPSLGEDHSERDSSAYPVYLSAIKSLEDLRRQIEDQE